MVAGEAKGVFLLYFFMMYMISRKRESGNAGEHKG